MGERTILSSFRTDTEANQAAEQIRSLGIDVAQVDGLRTAVEGEEPPREAFPITGRIPSLASLTLHTQPTSRNAGILLAMDPDASGMSDGNDEDNDDMGRNYLLTVVCDESKVEQAVSIIKACNGYT